MMRGVIILLILIFLSQKAVSSITPAIHVPSDFNKNRFVNYNNAISNGSGNNTCDKVAFKNYYPSEYTSLKIKNPPFNWIGPYISIHFLSLNPLLVRRRRYSR
ncbi:hypothetical protein ACTZN5_12550, partial [Klebsiella pneumoniae]